MLLCVCLLKGFLWGRHVTRMDLTTRETFDRVAKGHKEFIRSVEETVTRSTPPKKCIKSRKNQPNKSSPNCQYAVYQTSTVSNKRFLYAEAFSAIYDLNIFIWKAILPTSVLHREYLHNNISTKWRLQAEVKPKTFFKSCLAMTENWNFCHWKNGFCPKKLIKIVSELFLWNSGIKSGQNTKKSYTFCWTQVKILSFSQLIIYAKFIQKWLSNFTENWAKSCQKFGLYTAAKFNRQFKKLTLLWRLFSQIECSMPLKKSPKIRFLSSLVSAKWTGKLRDDNRAQKQWLKIFNLMFF